MTTCVSSGCLEMTSQLALARLKTRVNPVFRSEVRTAFIVNVHARIDEKGDVAVFGLEGGSEPFNDSIRAAVERWKFTPIADESGPRCVDTAIPINVRPGRL
jgi:hypothetical protein